MITASSLKPFLKTRWLGHRLLSLPEVNSTNLLLQSLAETGEAEGLVAVAERQTGGMGRNGRHWLSPPGKNLMFSLLLRPDCAPGKVPQLAILSALSLIQALQEETHLSPKVKWPNDLLLNDRKLAGILCKMACYGMQTNYAIVGIGLNVNMVAEDMPSEIQEIATSLAICTGKEWEHSSILGAFLSTFEKDFTQWLEAGSLAPFLSRWSNASALDGHWVKIQQSQGIAEGIAEGITPDGLLQLRTSDNEQCLVSAGDAHLLKEPIGRK